MKQSRNTADSSYYKNVLTNMFATRVKKVMDDKNVSQSELARRAGLSRAAISSVLNSTKNPSLLTATAISRALDVSLDSLVAGNIADMPDPNQFKKMFKTDFLKELGQLVSDSKYYSSDFISMTQEQKDTVLRLIYAYLNVGRTGKPLNKKN